MAVEFSGPPDLQLNTPEDARRFLLITRIIHFALVIGLTLFGGVAVLVSFKELSFIPDFANPLIWIAVLGCIVSLGLSFSVAGLHGKVSASPTTPRSALQQYQVMCIMRWAVIESGALFAGVVIIVTRNVLPIGLFLASLAYLASRYPSQQEFISYTGKRKG